MRGEGVIGGISKLSWPVCQKAVCILLYSRFRVQITRICASLGLRMKLTRICASLELRMKFKTLFILILPLYGVQHIHPFRRPLMFLFYSVLSIYHGFMAQCVLSVRWLLISVPIITSFFNLSNISISNIKITSCGQVNSRRLYEEKNTFKSE